MAVPPAPAGPAGSGVSSPAPSRTAPSDPAEERPSQASGPLRVAVLALCLLVTVGCLASLGWLVATRSSEQAGSYVDRVQSVFEGSNEIQQQRDTVMSQARQFMLRLNTYGPDLLAEDGTMPTYRERITEVITPKFRTSFDQQVVVAEQLVAQTGQARRAEVYATGVSAMDTDSATVLVAGAYTNSYPRPGHPRQRLDDEPAPFRVAVKLVKTEGSWLVDEFDPVTKETDAQSPSVSPSVPPSPSPPGTEGEQ